MNYYYDLALNFSTENIMFYDWDNTDPLEQYKKIPLFQVNSKTIKDFINNNITVSKDFINLIKGKSKGDNSEYIALFADKNGSIVLEFDNKGKSIYRSFVPIEDELNILEILYTTNITKIDYTIEDKILYQKDIRKIRRIKKIIKTEIQYLSKKKDYSKLKYLYTEWFMKTSVSSDNMIKEMYDKLDNNFSQKELQIYELIKLSYNKA